ncbi:MAG: DUF2007 domain-containing protein [Anaerolineales bacterium]
MGGGSPIGTELTLVAQFYDSLEAEIASGALRAAGVECLLSGEGARTAFPVQVGPLGRIDVLVRSEDASRAKLLLGSIGAKPIEPKRPRGRRKNQGNSPSSH